MSYLKKTGKISFHFSNSLCKRIFFHCRTLLDPLTSPPTIPGKLTEAILAVRLSTATVLPVVVMVEEWCTVAEEECIVGAAVVVACIVGAEQFPPAMDTAMLNRYLIDF